MGNHSASRFRRMGREAFTPGVTNPEDLFRYPRKSWYYESHLKHFMDGWKESADAYVAEVPCKWCGKETFMRTTGCCYDCGMLLQLIESYPDIARKMLKELN